MKTIKERIIAGQTAKWWQLTEVRLCALFLAVGIAGPIGAFFLAMPVGAESPRQPRAAVVLGYELSYGPIVHDEYGNNYRPPNGMVVKWASGSAACPPIAPETNLGEAIAYLLEQGFHIEQPIMPTRCVLTR